MNEKSTDIVGWMTVKGVHIPIKKGQSRESAMTEFLRKADEDDPFQSKNEGNRSGKSLSKKEFAVWYQKIGEIKRGGHVEKMSNGDKLIPIGNKIVVTSGTYEKPKSKNILVFPSEEEMFSGLEELKGD